MKREAKKYEMFSPTGGAEELGPARCNRNQGSDSQKGSEGQSAQIPSSNPNQMVRN